MIRLIAALVATVAIWTLPLPAASAEPTCSEAIGIGEAGVTCKLTSEEARSRIQQGSSGPAPTHRYTLERVCVATTEIQGPDCTPHPCTEVDNGHYYALLESPIAANPPVWTQLGYVCLGDPNELLGPTTEDVMRAFKRLSWPAATLTIQPTGGETLVNYPTAFHTRDDRSVTQTVTLLGQSVVIEATPVEWTWHWARPGDGAPAADTTPHTTSHPGSPEPRATNTHAYRTGGLTVHPSVDVTYRGRYRLNNGPWTDIPDTHTVPGSADQPLTVLEARPSLVR